MIDYPESRIIHASRARKKEAASCGAIDVNVRQEVASMEVKRRGGLWNLSQGNKECMATNGNQGSKGLISQHHFCTMGKSRIVLSSSYDNVTQ